MSGSGLQKKEHGCLYTSLIILLIIGFISTHYRIAIILGIIFLIIYSIRYFVRKSKEKRLAEEVSHFNARLLAVQNAISPVYSDTLSGTPNQITKRFQAYLTNHTDALNDALDMIHNADNPKAYKDAKRKYDKEIDALCKAEKQDLIPLDPLPSNIRRDFYKNEPTVINEMLSRMWRKYQEQAIELKTQKGRRNHIKSYFELLSFHSDMLYPENLTKIKKQRAQASIKYGLEDLDE